MGDPVNRFEDLNVWKKSIRLSIDLYNELKNCKDFGLRDQLQRAAVSIPSNIAAGYERNSNKEYIQYLYISKGSTSELRTQLYIAREVELLPKELADDFIDQTRKIAGMLHNLIQTRIERFQ